ncbi:MAG TPA: TRAP transporter substrate-binding protein DctP [Oligella sp.]|nr:TRAP transporter substrate-binding protein DctP [Oligella sp.]
MSIKSKTRLKKMLNSAAFCTLSFCTITASAAELTLRAAVFAPVDTTWGAPFQILADRINETGKGVLQIRTIGPEAIPSTEQPNAVRSGLIDMVATPPGMYKSAMIEANAQDLSNLSLAEQRASGGYDALNQILSRKLGAIALTTYGTGVPFHLYFTSDDIQKPEDIQELRVRSQPIFSPFFSELSLNQSMIPISEVYTALDRKVVQGYGFAAWGLSDMGWDQLTKTRIDPGFYSVVVNVIINEKKLKQLTPEQTDVITNAVKWFEEEMLVYKKQMDEKNLTEQQNAGIQTVDFGPEFAERAHNLYWNELEKLSPKEIPKLRVLLEK